MLLPENSTEHSFKVELVVWIFVTCEDKCFQLLYLFVPSYTALQGIQEKNTGEFVLNTYATIRGCFSQIM